jgi:hypothetical protein
MRQAIDDFPGVGVSRMRASGAIGPGDKTTTVSFDEVAFTVGLQHIHFRTGGGWSFFVCPCGRRARTLRLYEGGLACRGCLKARGFRHRVELIPTERRAAYHAPRLIARLTSATPARLHSGRGRMLDKRVNMEFTLRRSLIVARQHALDEHDKMLKP